MLDTDVFSYLMKSGDKRAQAYQRHTDNKVLAVSFVTVGELLFGASKKKWGNARVEELKQRLRSVITVPFDFSLCQVYADLKTRLLSMGRNCADNDLWIAACAVRHSIPLISNNRQHFENIPDLVLISEAPLALISQSQAEMPFDVQKAESDKPHVSTESQ